MCEVQGVRVLLAWAAVWSIQLFTDPGGWLFSTVLKRSFWETNASPLLYNSLIKSQRRRKNNYLSFSRAAGNPFFRDRRKGPWSCPRGTRLLICRGHNHHGPNQI